MLGFFIFVEKRPVFSKEGLSVILCMDACYKISRMKEGIVNEYYLPRTFSCRNNNE